MTDIDCAIKWHIENQMIITIEREKIDKNEKITGFPLMLSEELLMMSKIDDFRDDGFLVMRIEDITDAYSKESDAFYEEICVKEGLKQKAFENPIIDIAGFASVLKQLVCYNKFVTIQCEFEDDELYYSIGKITKFEDNVVSFNNFDKMGIWEETERIIPTDKVTLISIEDYYSNMFYK
jgi:hypothetical protein